MGRESFVHSHSHSASNITLHLSHWHATNWPIYKLCIYVYKYRDGFSLWLLWRSVCMLYAFKLWLVYNMLRYYLENLQLLLYNLQQFSSSELPEQCCFPSHTWILRIQAPVVIHLKSSAAKHARLSANNRNSYISRMTMLNYVMS